MNTRGFHDSALCCVGAVKNSCIFILYLGELSVITLNSGLQPLFPCGTILQFNRLRHSVAFVFASVAVFVQPR